jgi:cell pole-organizing protein PopZ
MKRKKSPLSQITLFEAAPMSGVTVDRANGVIEGVSVITSGIKARGHDLEVDDTTVAQMLSCGKEMGTVTVKWNHQTGADAVNGFLTNFRADGKQLRADWHLLKSHDKYEQAMELAERMPSNIGLSAAFSGKEETKGNKKFARCSELIAVDLVAQPAANPSGLFSRRVDSLENDMPKEEQENQEPTLADVLAEVRSMNGRLQAIEDAIENADSEEEPEEEESEEEQEAPEAAPGTVEAELSELRRAVVFLSRERDRDIEEAEEAQVSHAFAVINEKVTMLAEQNAKLTAENSALMEAFKTRGGKAASVNLSDSSGPVTMLEAGQPGDDWEKLVQEKKAGGMTAPEAIAFAVKNRPDLYQVHLARIGVVTSL